MRDKIRGGDENLRSKYKQMAADRGETYSSRQSSRDASRSTLAGVGNMTGLWIRERLIIKITP